MSRCAELSEAEDGTFRKKKSWAELSDGRWTELGDLWSRRGEAFLKIGGDVEPHGLGQIRCAFAGKLAEAQESRQIFEMNPEGDVDEELLLTCT